ncbi:MAG: beta-lactamase family protein [Anaerolineaceae bacterium]|nr:beta-lactamase family protein [Anaerolineaceae bacterium]
MFWLRILFTFIISFSLVYSISDHFPAQQIKSKTTLDTFTSHLGQRIPAIMQAYDIPGVNIAIIQNGEIVWLSTFGQADLETNREMTIDTYMRVQSISKSVTAWGALKLVEQGKIDLDIPVKDYLNNWQFPENQFSTDLITTRQLLTHTSGMPIGDFYNFYSPEEIIPSLEESLFTEAKLIQEPGKSFSYSNTGYNLLELLIEEVTGQDFADYMDQEILQPLGMQHSSFEWSPQWNPPVPTGYDLSGNPIPVYVYPEKASGGLFSTVEDIAKYVIASMSEFSSSQSVITTEGIHSMHSIWVNRIGEYNLVFDGYGFGHYVETLSDGRTAISHGGQGTGWMTHYHAVPNTGDGIVILTNSQRSWPMIAYLLTDWAEWSGLPALGMSRIILGNNMLWGFTGFLWFAIIWELWNLVSLLASSKKSKIYLTKKSIPERVFRMGLSIIIFSGLIWSISQDYLFITSVFPMSAEWAGKSLLIFAITLFISAFISGLPD